MKLLTNLFTIYMITYGNRLRTWPFFRLSPAAHLAGLRARIKPSAT